MKFDEMSDNKKMRTVLHCSVPYFSAMSANLAVGGNLKEAWEANKFIGFISEVIADLDPDIFFERIKTKKEENDNV